MMKIDGVSVEPSPADDPYAMGHVALDIDCDLDALAQKLHLEVHVTDFKAMFGGKIQACFTGKDAVEWCMRKEFCSDEGDAVHLLNRMLRRGLMHHCSLNKLMENNATAYYRFPQDHFKILVDQTGAYSSLHKRLRPSAKTLQGAAALQERWYADVPTLPPEKVHKLGQVLERLNCRDIQRGLRRHYMVFPGNELVQVLIESGVAKDEMDALAVGNAFLRAGLFHHTRLKAPLRNDDTLYRLAKCQYELLMNREQVLGMSYGRPRNFSADEKKVSTGVGGSSSNEAKVNDELGKQGKTALELATSSRYWTSFRASKLYELTLTVVEGFIDMSDDWDSHVDQMYPTYCECYLTRDKEATQQNTDVSLRTLHPVWNSPVAFVDVDYLDTVHIDLKAHTQLGNDLIVGSLEFTAHEVMGAGNQSVIVEFDCGSRQYAECAASIIKVQFDPAVAGPAEGTEGSKHHRLLAQGARKQEDLANSADVSRSRGSKNQSRRSTRGSVRRTSIRASAEDMDPAFISVEGCLGCVLLDDDATDIARRMDSFSTLPLDAMSRRDSIRSSIPNSAAWPDTERSNSMLQGGGSSGVGVNALRASMTLSEGPARRGSTGSDLPDIDEDDVFNEPLPGNSTGGGGNSIGGGRGGGKSNSSSSPDRLAKDGAFTVSSAARVFTQIQSASSGGSKPNDASNVGGSAVEGLEHGRDPPPLQHVIGGGNAACLPPGRIRRRTTWDPATFMSNRWTGGTPGAIGWNAAATTAVAEAGAAATLTGLGDIREDDGPGGSRSRSVERGLSWGRTSTLAAPDGSSARMADGQYAAPL